MITALTITAREYESAVPSDSATKALRHRVLHVNEPAHRQELLYQPVLRVFLDRSQRGGEVVDRVVGDHVAEVEQSLRRSPLDIAREGESCRG